MQRKDVSETDRVWAGGGDQVREEASGGMLRGAGDRVPGGGQAAVWGRLQDQVEQVQDRQCLNMKKPVQVWWPDAWYTSDHCV